MYVGMHYGVKSFLKLYRYNVHTCFPCHMHLIFWACVNSQVGVRGTYFVKWLCISWNLKRTRMGLQKTFHCPWIDSTELMVNRFAVVILYYFMLELIKLKNMPTLLIIIVPYRHSIGKCFVCVFHIHSSNKIYSLL